MKAKEVGLILIQTDHTYRLRIEGVLNYPFQHAEIKDVDINSETKVVTLKVKK